MAESARGAYLSYLIKSWEETNPKQVAALRKAGKLDRALHHANKRIGDRISDLLAQGARDYEARELILPDYAYPPLS